MKEYVVSPQPLKYPSQVTDTSFESANKHSSDDLCIANMPGASLSIDTSKEQRRSRRTRFPFKGESCTPDNVPKTTDLLTVRRKLFSTGPESDNQITEVALGSEMLSATDEKMVKEYGMVLPTHILGPNGPKLVKRNPVMHEQCVSDFPHFEEKEMEERARTNHEIVRAWLKKADITAVVGKGKESTSKQAIQPQGKHSRFLEPANRMLQSLTGMQRYPIELYIKDLHQKEFQAVQTARIYRNRFEREECKAKEAAASAAKEQLSSVTFWRNNIAEQCSRGGKMVHLALKKSCRKK